MVQYVKAGRLRLLCSFDERRLDWAPEVPTVRELGYPFDVCSWLALGAPKGVPAPVMGKLRQVFKQAMNDPEFKNLLQTMYMPIVYRSPEEYEKLVEEGYKTNEKMIFELGLHKSQKKGG
jgi:tripartite-type tricarboxylate transporter receptor subunit TctC